ncbi:unnamed protein product, partial [marine sediment metagenome]
PIVEARDQYGNVDTTYAVNVVASENDLGTLTGTTTQAPVLGVATFTDLVYTATIDHDTFEIEFDSGGFTQVSSAGVDPNVVATQLVITQQPAVSVSGVALVTQPIVAARDAGNITDTDYVTNVVASENDAGTLTGTTTQTPLAGVATFTDLIYTATADVEVFQIDFTSTGITGVTSIDVTCGVVATKLVFTTQPAGSVSGVALTTQPVVEARNAADVLDTGYVTNVVASEDDLGTLTGTTTVAPVGGVATFTDLVYTARAGGVTFQIDVTSVGITGATSNDVTSVVTIPPVGGGAPPAVVTVTETGSVDLTT